MCPPEGAVQFETRNCRQDPGRFTLKPSATESEGDYWGTLWLQEGLEACTLTTL